MSLSNFKVLVFDVYGTLIDWESGIYDGLSPLLKKSQSGLSREQVLHEYAISESQVQTEFPSMIYSQVLSTVYGRLAKSVFNLEGISQEECDAFGQSIKDWVPFPDTIRALHALKTQGFKLVVNSDVDRESFSKSREKMETSDPDHLFTFDLVVTAQDVGSYKPSLDNFHFALDKIGKEWGAKPEDVVVVAQSLFHDHDPANKLGLKSAWIARTGVIGATEKQTEHVKYDWKFDTLGDMADAVSRERA